jgi:hypothetical protein
MARCNRVNSSRSCGVPSFFSKTVFFLILGTWLLIAFLTSYYLLLQQNYYTNRGTNNSNNNNNNNNSWVLLGGLTATTISFRIRATDNLDLKYKVNDLLENRRQRLVVTTDPKWEDAVFEREFITHVPSSSNTNNNDDDNNDTTLEVLNIDTEESGSTLVHSVTVTDLTPNTRYYYVIFELTTTDDDVDLSSYTQPQPQHQGRFMTAPNEGEARDFQFIASACSWTGSDVPIYTQILEQEILHSTAATVAAAESATTTIETKPSSLFFFHLGDFHYENLNVDSLERRIDAIDNVLSSAKQQRLWANVPLAVMWDDHDWLGNNKGGDTSQIGYQSALESYRVAFPHYEPLPSSYIADKCNNNNSTNSENTTTNTSNNNEDNDDDGNCNNNINNNNLNGNRGVYQAFTIGMVRFIMSDLRSEASESSIYSPEQREWLFKELEDSMKYDFVVWMSTGPWIATAKEGSDTWRGYSRDRKELSQHIQKTVTKKNLLVLASDAHMVAFDDGSNTLYGENDKEKQDVTGLNTTSRDPEYTRSFPILQTGPLDRMGSVKGGPYSDGCHTYLYERNHQYSVINFQLENRDETPCLTIRSYDQSNLIFTKKLCGPDIFGNSRNVGEDFENKTIGSCKAMYFSSTNMTLLIIAACLLLVAFVLTYFVFLGCCVSFGIAMLILIFLAATFAAGVIIPIALGIEQYEAFETIVICVLQITTVVLYLTAWQFCSDKSNNERNDATTMHNHEEEEKAC